MADFVSGDTGSSLSVPCVDSEGSAINLTGCTVNLRWKDASGALVSKEMTIDDEANGIVSYKFGEGELYAPSMDFEVQITDVDGFILTILDLIAVTVRKALA
jgi:hypothetical protein